MRRCDGWWCVALLDGQVVATSPIELRHALTVDVLSRWFGGPRDRWIVDLMVDRVMVYRDPDPIGSRIESSARQAYCTSGDRRR
jgi:hypothetical protein